MKIAASHPALPGHFPGHPVVPGVVILDHVLAAAREAFPERTVGGIRKLKFLSLLLPEEPFDVHWSEWTERGVRFHCRSGDRVIAEGRLLPADD